MKKRTAVERLARELAHLWFDTYPAPEPLNPGWLRLARHVLARERRARGKRVGTVVKESGCWSVTLGKFTSSGTLYFNGKRVRR